MKEHGVSCGPPEKVSADLTAAFISSGLYTMSTQHPGTAQPGQLVGDSDPVERPHHDADVGLVFGAGGVGVAAAHVLQDVGYGVRDIAGGEVLAGRLVTGEEVRAVRAPGWCAAVVVVVAGRGVAVVGQVSQGCSSCSRCR